MEMLVIDESDAVYQTFRSKTILGLEVASLVAGGYKDLYGHFEWIIEADKSVNHRLFVPNP